MCGPLECGNMPEKAEQKHQPSKPREPIDRNRIYQADNANHHNQDKPVRSPKQPAIKSSDSNSLGLCSKVGRHQDTGQGKDTDRPRNQSTGKKSTDDEDISIPIYSMIEKIPPETLDF